MARDMQELADNLQAFLDSGPTASLAGQAHARKMIIELGSSHAEWPNFSEGLDERLHFGANSLIAGGLELLASPDHSSQAKSFMFAGAEALEFLVASPDTYRGSFVDEKLKCAAAYYLAGYHARAFVILDRALLAREEIGPLERMVAVLLKQDIAATHEATLVILASDLYRDQEIAAAIDQDELTFDDVVSRVALQSIARSVLTYLEYLRSGVETFLTQARERVQLVIGLAKEARFVDIWWWGKVIERLFDELLQTSLWSNLQPLMPPGEDNTLIRRYIVAAMQRNICTLWPSQLTALRKVAEPDRPSFCVRMPTSAGKTRIAELAILTAFRDFQGQNPKCIYIAPFRSLAVEVERSLRAAFDPLGFGVSELYGGYEYSEVQDEVVDAVSVVVVTPEKLDAMLRFAPDLFENVKCVIVDEGHTAGDTSERGLRAEFVLNRLLRRLPRESCRYVFASAVLPNADDFATWIGGNDESLVSSDWRPSRQMIGELRWRAEAPTRIVYTHAGHKPFNTDCFVPRFIEQVPGSGRRRRPYPDTPREVVALSAVRLAAQGSVLLFVPQRQHVETTGKAVLEAITLERLHNPGRSVEHLAVDLEQPEVASCLETISKQLGEGSLLAQCLRNGIAVHHGQLPWQVRQAMERFIGSGQAQIIVATTTLAAGVNLPIRTVLVKGLWQGAGERVDALTFWNICGRAGRGMREIEGQILFFMDLDREQWQIQRDRAYNLTLIDRPNAVSIMGVLYLLLKTLKRHWLQQIPEVSFEALCEKLANNDFNWMSEDESEGLAAWFRLLDDQLFALLSENLEEGDLADTLQAVLSDSLLSVQLASKPIEGVDLSAASRVISARLQFVRSRIPERTQRDRFYKLGLPIEDCLRLHESLEDWSGLLQEFTNWQERDSESKADWILRFVSYAANLPFAQVDDDKADALATLTVFFMSGEPLTQIAEKSEIKEFWKSPQEVAAEIESFCGFRLSWIANAVVSYVRAAGDGDLNLPAAVDALPAMFKYGTMKPVATAFAPFVEDDRALAEQLAEVCPHQYGDRAVLTWFRGVTVEDLVAAGVDQIPAEDIIRARERIIRTPGEQNQPEPTCALEVVTITGQLTDYEVVHAVAKEGVAGPCLELIGPDGAAIGLFRPTEAGIPEHWLEWARTSLSLAVENGAPILVRKRVA